MKKTSKAETIQKRIFTPRNIALVLLAGILLALGVRF